MEGLKERERARERERNAPEDSSGTKVRAVRER
jgi:hypothetical protein